MHNVQEYGKSQRIQFGCLRLYLNPYNLLNILYILVVVAQLYVCPALKQNLLSPFPKLVAKNPFHSCFPCKMRCVGGGEGLIYFYVLVIAHILLLAESHCGGF